MSPPPRFLARILLSHEAKIIFCFYIKKLVIFFLSNFTNIS